MSIVRRISRESSASRKSIDSTSSSFSNWGKTISSSSWHRHRYLHSLVSSREHTRRWCCGCARSSSSSCAWCDGSDCHRRQPQPLEFPRLHYSRCIRGPHACVLNDKCRNLSSLNIGLSFLSSSELLMIQEILFGRRARLGWTINSYVVPGTRTGFPSERSRWR